ncbi:MAG: nuclear transport factor 2 family protein [Gaiellales bacterium]
MASHVDSVRNVYTAFARGDIQPLLDLLGERVQWYEAEHVTYWPGGPFVGAQAIVEGVLARIPGDFDGFEIEISRITGCGETVLMEGRYHATAKSTGRTLDAQVAHVWDFENGKVVRWQQYSDTWQFAEVTGVAPLSTVS